MKQTLLFLTVLVVLVAGYFVWQSAQQPVGQHQLPADTVADLVRVTHPQPNDIIKSPYTVTGEARGQWYFEASFPIRLEVGGVVVTTTHGQALGEWMTDAFVPFAAQLNFEVSTPTLATLVLENDNPSGLPERVKQKRIPVLLAP